MITAFFNKDTPQRRRKPDNYCVFVERGALQCRKSLYLLCFFTKATSEGTENIIITVLLLTEAPSNAAKAYYYCVFQQKMPP